MANTYTQLYIQLVFAVQGRMRLIPHRHKEELQQYMTGIIQKKKHKLLAISCMPDHTHVVLGLHPEEAISGLVRDLKASASGFISEKQWIRAKRFHWQEGYGAFSYARQELSQVISYVRNQEEHHRRRTFREEYQNFLKEAGIDYDERYLFEWIEDAREEG